MSAKRRIKSFAEKTILTLNGLALLVLCVAIGWGWAAMTETPWLEYKGVPFPVVWEGSARKLSPGDRVSLSVTRCNLDAGTHTYIASHTLESVPRGQHPDRDLKPTPTTIQPGCHSVVSDPESNYVPLGTPPGQYRFRGYAEAGGIIKNFQIEWYSEVFTVGSGTGN